MERQQIEVFLTLAEQLHFGRTAELLLLSQARVSQSIKAFEREVGAPLFVRTSRRVELTPLGAQLHRDLAPAYAAVMSAVDSASRTARQVSGRLKVAFLGPVAGDLLSTSVSRFTDEYAECVVELQATEIADPLLPLRRGDVDLVLTQLPAGEPGTTSSAPILREARVLATSSAHPLAGRACVTLEDLASHRIPLPQGAPPANWVDTYQPWETPAGVPIERGPAVATFGELLSMIAAGQCVCTVAAHNSVYHPRPGITYVPIEPAPPFEFGFVWRASTETAQLRAFVAAVEDIVETLGGAAAAATTDYSRHRPSTP